MLPSLRRKTLQELRSNWKQFLPVMATVILGTSFYGAMYPAARNMVRSLRTTYEALAYMDFVVQMPPAPVTVVESVRRIAGVSAAEGRLVFDAGLQLGAGSGRRIALRLVSLPDRGQPSVNRLDLVEGAPIRRAGEVLLQQSFARHHRLRPGDHLQVSLLGQRRRLRVAGTVFSPEYVSAARSSASPVATPSLFGVSWIRFSDLSSWIGLSGEINNVALRLEPSARKELRRHEPRIRRALTGLLGSDEQTTVLTAQQTPSGGLMEGNIQGDLRLMLFFSILFLAGTTIITGVLLGRLVKSQRRQIGTLRALGLSRREVIVHYLSFGLLIGVVGGALGSVGGYLGSFLVVRPFIDYIVGGCWPRFVNAPEWGQIALGFVVVAASSTLSGAYATWVQSGAPPGLALRLATPLSTKDVGRVHLRWMPLTVRWALRNLLRTPGRSLATFLGVIAGATMIVCALALWDSIDRTVGDYFDAHAYDLQIDTGGLQTAEEVEARARSIPGVAFVQSVLAGPISIRTRTNQRASGLALVVDDKAPALNLRAIEGAPPLSSRRGVWIGSNLERVLGLGPGAEVELQAMGKKKTVRVAGVVSHVVGRPVFIPRSLAASWAPDDPMVANAVWLRVKAGQREAAARAALSAIPGAAAVRVQSDLRADTERFMDFYRAVTVIFGAFGLILTLALVFNTVNINVRERANELLILRAFGTTRAEISRTVTVELLVIAALALPIGVPIGRLAGFVMAQSYDTAFYGMLPHLSLRSLLLAPAVLLAALYVARIPGLRWVQRARLGDVSKAQSH